MLFNSIVNSFCLFSEIFRLTPLKSTAYPPFCPFTTPHCNLTMPQYKATTSLQSHIVNPQHRTEADSHNHPQQRSAKVETSSAHLLPACNIKDLFLICENRRNLRILFFPFSFFLPPYCLMPCASCLLPVPVAFLLFPVPILKSDPSDPSDPCSILSPPDHLSFPAIRNMIYALHLYATARPRLKLPNLPTFLSPPVPKFKIYLSPLFLLLS